MEFPGEIRRVVGDVAWSDDTEGQSGDIWRAGGSYVKRDAADEHDRLRWLSKHFEVPEIRDRARPGAPR